MTVFLVDQEERDAGRFLHEVSNALISGAQVTAVVHPGTGDTKVDIADAWPSPLRGDRKNEGKPFSYTGSPYEDAAQRIMRENPKPFFRFPFRPRSGPTVQEEFEQRRDARAAAHVAPPSDFVKSAERALRDAHYGIDRLHRRDRGAHTPVHEKAPEGRPSFTTGLPLEPEVRAFLSKLVPGELKVDGVVMLPGENTYGAPATFEIHSEGIRTTYELKHAVADPGLKTEPPPPEKRGKTLTFRDVETDGGDSCEFHLFEDRTMIVCVDDGAFSAGLTKPLGPVEVDKLLRFLTTGVNDGPLTEAR